MIFVVTKIRQVRITAATEEEAISKVQAGEGELLSVQDVANQMANPKPAPADQWPLWAKGLRLWAKSGDKGVGDVLHRIIGDENSEAFKVWYKKTFNQDCGCAGRQALWNQMYPLT